MYHKQKIMSSTQQKSIANNNMSDKPTPKVFKFKYDGKTYAYFNQEQKKKRAKELKIKLKDITQLVNKKKLQKIAYNTQTKETKTIDISKPLLLKDFSKEKLSNAQIFTGGTDELKIFDKLPKNLKRQVAISFDYKAQISKDSRKGKMTITRTITKNTNLEELAKDAVREYFSGAVAYIDDIEISNLRVYENNAEGSVLPLSGMKLKLEKPPVLRMFDNIDYTERGHCVRDLMNDYYGNRYKPKNFAKMNTIDDVLIFCRAKDIKLLAYDILGKIICSHYPEKKNKNKTLICLVHHNHLYPLKSCKLKRVRPLKFDDNEIVRSRDIFNYRLMEIIHGGEIPNNIRMKSDEIISFDHDETIFICNDEFDECKKIMKKFGLYDRINTGITLTSVARMIEGLYVKEKIETFFPQSIRFIKGGYNYFTNNEVESENVKTIDANKMYPSCLRELSCLYRFDIILDEVVDNNTIEEGFLYVVKPKQHSILLPNTNIYLGDHLLFCKQQGLEFDILQKASLQKCENYYRDMIDELWKKVDNSTFKKLMNRLIGSFESESKASYSKFLKFVNEDEKKRTKKGYFKKIKEDLFINFETNTKITTTNKKIVAVQVKDLSRRKMYLKMKELGINESNLVKIQTDSITWITNKKIDGLGTDLGMWKAEKTNLKKFEVDYTDNDIEKLLYRDFDIKNELCNSYAGAGKTFHIINNLIPKLDKDYIVLSPSHSSLKEYCEKDIKHEVIQKYNYNDEDISYSNIIVDEVGMVDYKGLVNIYKWSLQGKKIYAFGDFNQLIPVGHVRPLNTDLYIKLLFPIRYVMDTNYRNSFTREFYDRCIEDLVNKEYYRSKYLNNENATNVCCFKNETCDKYNKIIAERLGFESIFNVGAKIICNTNELRDRGIYNKFVFTVIEEKQDAIKLDNGEWISKKECMKKADKKTYFSFAYARTLHSYQGESVRDFYFPKEELKYVNSRMFYTLISRIKEEIELPKQNIKQEVNKKKPVIENEEKFRQTTLGECFDIKIETKKKSIPETSIKIEYLADTLWKQSMKETDDYSQLQKIYYERCNLVA
jgi:hypothetical protein